MDLKKVFLASALLFGSIGAAHAVPMTWVDSIDFNPDRYIGPGSSHSYTHSILDEGFTPFQDFVYDYQLEVQLYDDDRDPFWNPLEVALINVPGLIGDRVYFDLSGSEFGGWSLAGFLLLNLTGQYNVTISSILGDFYLGGSTLTAWGDDNGSHEVPEPGTLGLMGLGLLGGAFAARRKRAAKKAA